MMEGKNTYIGIIVLLGLTILAMIWKDNYKDEIINKNSKERDSLVYVSKFLADMNDKKGDSLISEALKHENKIVNIENHYDNKQENIVNKAYDPSFVDSLFYKNLWAAETEYRQLFNTTPKDTN